LPGTFFFGVYGLIPGTANFYQNDNDNTWYVGASDMWYDAQSFLGTVTLTYVGVSYSIYG